jgi:hypothetical protein
MSKCTLTSEPYAAGSIWLSNIAPARRFKSSLRVCVHLNYLDFMAVGNKRAVADMWQNGTVLEVKGTTTDSVRYKVQRDVAEGHHVTVDDDHIKKLSAT